MSQPVGLPARFESYTIQVPSVSGLFDAFATAETVHVPAVRTARSTSQSKMERHCSQTTVLPSGATWGDCAPNPGPGNRRDGPGFARSAMDRTLVKAVVRSMNATVLEPMAERMRCDPATGSTSVSDAVAASKTKM